MSFAYSYLFMKGFIILLKEDKFNGSENKRTTLKSDLCHISFTKYSFKETFEVQLATRCTKLYAL